MTQTRLEFPLTPGSICINIETLYCHTNSTGISTNTRINMHKLQNPILSHKLHCMEFPQTPGVHAIRPYRAVLRLSISGVHIVAPSYIPPCTDDLTPYQVYRPDHRMDCIYSVKINLFCVVSNAKTLTKEYTCARSM